MSLSFARLVTSATLAIIAIVILTKVQGSISLGELIIIAIFASIVTIALESFIIAPRQFLLALKIRETER